MGKDTKIGWCDSSVNLQMGCDGCELWNKKVKKCYAGILTERWGGKKGWPISFGQPTIFMERLNKALSWPDLRGKDRPSKPWLNGLPRIIFLNDMGDTFTESLPIDWLAPALPQMADSPHQWLILTKRAKRMREFFDRYACPENVWTGVSITGPHTNRVRELLEVKSMLKFISYEPVWSPTLFPYSVDNLTDNEESRQAIRKKLGGYSDKIHWLILGAESGHNARKTDEDLFRFKMNRNKRNGLPVFLKQLGSVWAKENIANSQTDSKAEEWLHWPIDLRVREMPIQP